MRIIAGSWRGRVLTAPPGLETRPTADRVRETLFSMLTSRLGSFEGLRVGDLYAGSGALGLEALSRGAGHATFVDSNSTAARIIAENAARLGATDRVRVIAASALNLPSAGPFDLIFADPPYATGSGTAAAKAVHEAGWLAAGGWMAIETDRGESVIPPGDWTLDAERVVGRAKLSLLRRP